MNKITFIILFLTSLSFSNIKAQNISIIPQPNFIEAKNLGTFTLDNSTSIVASRNQHEIAKALQLALKQDLNLDLDIVKAKTEHSIQFKQDVQITDEGYTLDISKNRIIISAS